MSFEEREHEMSERLRLAKRERQETLAALHPPCPLDGLPGSYVGLIGAFSTARLTFVCPNDDAFTYNRDTGQMWVIPPSDRTFIRPETLDLLEGSGPVQDSDVHSSSDA
jgi:hypothetical protein